MQNNSESKESLDSRGLDFAHNAIYNKEKNLIKRNNFLKVSHASTGFMMIKREILTKLYDKHTEPMIKTSALSKEDG